MPMTTDPVIDAPTPTPAMPSRTIARRALTLPVRGNSNGAFVVASGSEPGKTYIVQSHGGRPLSCDCIGGQSGHDCSHVWAARAHADPATRRALLAIVRPARRMGREAAERLVVRLCETLLEVERLGSGNRAGTAAAKRLDDLGRTIVARLTGHPADDGDGAA